MKDFDLNQIWKDADGQADAYYDNVESQIVKLAKRQSKSILQKLYRNILMEWISGILLLGGLAYLFRELDNFSSLVIGLTLIALMVWVPYGNMLKKIRETPSQNLVTAISNYIQILGQFIRRLKIFMWILMPLSFIYGYYIGATDDSAISEQLDQQPLWEVVVGSLLYLFFVIILFWSMFKWYIPELYGKPKKQFEELLEDLQSDS